MNIVQATTNAEIHSLVLFFSAIIIFIAFSKALRFAIMYTQGGFGTAHSEFNVITRVVLMPLYCYRLEFEKGMQIPTKIFLKLCVS